MDITKKVNYCLSCINKPCKEGCPLNNDITKAIALYKDGKEEMAYDVFTKTSVLSSVCGRICPHENQCEGKCIRGIKGIPVSIGEIEYTLADKFLDKPFVKTNEFNNKKVAVVGGGPSGLTCAAFLAMKGINVTIFEKHDSLGGILAHGIPDFRLPKDVLKKNIDKIVNLGIEVKLNKELGKDFSLEELRNNYDALYLSVGANKSRKMNIAGEELDGVLGGNETLEEDNWPDIKDKVVAVSGGGNTAMDVCRVAKRKGARKVVVIYRRSEKEMPATRCEISEAKNEGIEFMFKTNILEILGDKKVEKLHCIKTELTQKEGEKRLSPVNIEGSDFVEDFDYVFMAVGSMPDKELTDKLHLELTKWGTIQKDENNMTSFDGVFVGGDIAGGTSTVAYAAKAGRDTSEFIINYLKK